MCVCGGGGGGGGGHLCSVFFFICNLHENMHPIALYGHIAYHVGYSNSQFSGRKCSLVYFAQFPSQISDLQQQLNASQSRETRLQTAVARSKSRSDCLEKDNEELLAENSVLTRKLLEAEERLLKVRRVGLCQLPCMLNG